MLYKIAIGITNVRLEKCSAILNFVKNTFLHTPPKAYIRFAPNSLASINPPTYAIPIKRLRKYCSPLKQLANEHKRGGSLEMNSHNSITFNPIVTKLLRYGHIHTANTAFCAFLAFFGQFCTFIEYVFRRTPTTLLSQFLRNSLRLFKSPERLKIIKRSSKSQRAWPGRSHEVRCFATKLHTVITSVYIV